jgi:hypothetical protein
MTFIIIYRLCHNLKKDTRVLTSRTKGLPQMTVTRKVEHTHKQQRPENNARQTTNISTHSYTKCVHLKPSTITTRKGGHALQQRLEHTTKNKHLRYSKCTQHLNVHKYLAQNVQSSALCVHSKIKVQFLTYYLQSGLALLLG